MNLYFPSTKIDNSYAARIQSVTSSGGIEAWLLEDHTLPVVWTSFAFRGGASLDPEGKAGNAAIFASMLTESVAEFDTTAFHRRLADKAIRLSFGIQREMLYGSVRTLKTHADTAFELLGKALQEPALLERDFERMRDAIAADVSRGLGDPNEVAGLALDRRNFEGHPFARPVFGRLETIASIELADLRAIHSRLLARNRLVVVAVGAIRPDELAAALDRAFAPLPVSDTPPIPPSSFRGLGEEVVTRMDFQQSAIAFARPAPSMNDPDSAAAAVLNHCLGNGSATSRLFAQLRDRRGLCYSVWTELDQSKTVSRLVGRTSVRNDRVYEALDVIRDELRRLKAEAVSTEEVEAAKRYMIGSQLLQLDTSQAICSMLTAMKIDERDPAYIDGRTARINAVCLDDVAGVCARFLGDGDLLVAIAGNPPPR